MTNPLNIVIFGATGAVGGEVLETLLTMPDVARITVLVRRPLATPLNSKITQHIVDVFGPASYAALLKDHDVAICTFGVGEPSKTSREEFIRVDKTAVLAFASACRTANIAHFELLSSVGTDATSRSFYLKTKGELRDAIAGLGFQRFSAFQPSMIITPSNRYGVSQAVLLKLWPLLSPLLIGPLTKFRGIRVEHLGAAMAQNIQTAGQGTEILHYQDIRALSCRT